MNNAKLTFEQMKEIMDLFIKHKLHALKVGDFELQKNYYETPERFASTGDNKILSQEDPLFFSAPQMPPEMEALIASMQMQSK